jgi:hypothetical protein
MPHFKPTHAAANPKIEKIEVIATLIL